MNSRVKKSVFNSYVFLSVIFVIFLFRTGTASAGSVTANPSSSSRSSETLKIEGAKVHPTVFITNDDIKRARQNIKQYGWAGQIADAVIREADNWLKKDDEWLRRVVPPPGAAFAVGISGCPVCGANWGPWARDGASFDRPGRVACPNGHTLPDPEHPDDGTGYRGPDGRIHYFVGAYNAWVVETLTFGALENLVYAYTLTSDERYAAKAAVILDALAAIYPASHKGAWDYPSDPPSGRLSRPWYQASRVLIHYVDHYDHLFNSPSLDASSVLPSLTRRQNIERNMLLDGGAYCYEQSKAGSLHNGEADYERGVLAVGVCLGIPEYVSWTVDGPYGIRSLLANNIDRDGGYYETTPMYADHTRELYFTFAEPLLNYRGSAFPKGFNLYENHKFRSFLLPHNLPHHIAGRLPRYGDAPPGWRKNDMPARPFDRSDYDFLEKLYERTEDPAGKKVTGILLQWLAREDVEKMRRLESSGDPSGLTIPDRRIPAGFSLYREPGDEAGGGFSERMWILFHAGEAPAIKPDLPKSCARRLLGSDFMGQKGIAVLRAGEGKNSQGVHVRYGPSLNHGHYDDLNINYSARGYELTYDLGYGRTAATQTQAGWAKQTASHNLVVVNETSQLESGETGGSLHLFAETPLVRAVEASSDSCYKKQGVDVYRRLVALIGRGEEAYLLDVFRVRGGRRHDYSFHALSDQVSLEGISLGPREPGSLAGPDIDWSAAQLPDGDMRGHPNAWYWVPPPGNGFGFLAGPRRGRTDGAWSAEWMIDPQTQVRLHMAANPGTEVITASANGLYPHYPRAQYVLARRRGENLRSEFIAAVEPHGGRSGIKRVERLDLTPADAAVAPVAVKVVGDDDVIDYVLSAADDTPRRTPEGIVFAGRFAHIRVRNGRTEAATMAGVKELVGPGGERFQGASPGQGERAERPKQSHNPRRRKDVATPPAGHDDEPCVPGWSGTIAEVDAEKNEVTTTAALPADGTLNGSVIYFSNPKYTRNTAYRIVNVERRGAGSRIFLHASTGLGIGRVGAIIDGRTLTSIIPHEYANSVRGGNGSGFLDGKNIRSASGADTNVVSIRYGNPMTLILDSTAGFRPGDLFFYDDLQPGDSFEVLSVAFLEEEGGA
jgi:hypothetical protein